MIRRLTGAAIVAVALATAGCGGAGPSDDQPAVSLTAAPQITSWTTVGGVMVPLGKTDGPTTGNGQPFTGFTHTPQGAALAAITQSVQLATASDDRWPTILGAVAAPGEARDLYAANRALVSVDGLDPDAVPEIVGYTITDYSDTAARVDVVQRFSDDSLAAAHTRVAWTGDDWRLDLTSTDSATITALDTIPADLVDLEGTRK